MEKDVHGERESQTPVEDKGPHAVQVV